MLDNNKKIEVSAEQLEVIESALHTQSKILNVQAEAGGNTARQRLNEVKRLLAQLSQHKPAPQSQGCNRRAFGWFKGMRSAE
ncbi:hypothetical protein FIU94_00435 [Sulfitobacter sp. THAF37]|uniref:hypothetical protein n=1 Tax=Sulfitobacter sp. THAF37 TaxID=2587855 RepID=UPI001268DD77|nr:hypothetical protein [Sulfitobacter sp. THAF37]QFT57274.1 hypothetical protein FIU94_00435 [Sulfitobacter sp. THAF37]